MKVSGLVQSDSQRVKVSGLVRSDSQRVKVSGLELGSGSIAKEGESFGFSTVR